MKLDLPDHDREPDPDLGPILTEPLRTQLVWWALSAVVAGLVLYVV